MKAKILSAKPIADKIKEGLRKEIEKLPKKPCLAVISAGANTASRIYLKSQKDAADAIGIECRHTELPEGITQQQLIEKILHLNKDDSVTAIMLQLPLAKHLKAKEAINFINPLKDAEGIHPENLGKLILGTADVVVCTAQSCLELINAAGIDLYGKEAVIIGHTEILGKPLSLLLMDKFCTVTVCHIATSEKGRLEEHVKRAEILVVAAGKPNLISAKSIKEGAVVIDVGINKLGNKIVGDVDFEGACKKAAYITPVPGGVGTLTAIMLMKNVLQLYKIQQKSKS